MNFDITDPSPRIINCAINTILEAKEISVPEAVKKINSFPLSLISKSCITYRNTIRRRWQRCKNPSMKITLKSLLNQCNQLISTNIYKDRNTNWTKTLSKIKTGGNQLWHIKKHLTGQKKNITTKMIENDNSIY